MVPRASLVLVAVAWSAMIISVISVVIGIRYEVQQPYKMLFLIAPVLALVCIVANMIVINSKRSKAYYKNNPRASWMLTLTYTGFVISIITLLMVLMSFFGPPMFDQPSRPSRDLVNERMQDLWNRHAHEDPATFAGPGMYSNTLVDKYDADAIHRGYPSEVTDGVLDETMGAVEPQPINEHEIRAPLFDDDTPSFDETGLFIPGDDISIDSKNSWLERGLDDGSINPYR